ncbi:cysteine desulfurase CsdA-CsdE main protein CsdA [Vibrio ponticus]|nr:cysteine desulfurase CsdA-CsdE main protein CsdA [Vibrio ponticus]
MLYGKLAHLEAMPPWHGGGKMVEKVSFSGTTYSQLPGKFEAGTPNVAGAIALAKAIEWYCQFERSQVETHIHGLVEQTYHALNQHDDIRVIGYQPNASVISFVVDGVHHQDVATLLDQQGIAVRSGHHCAHPLMDALGVTGRFVFPTRFTTISKTSREYCKQLISVLICFKHVNKDKR